MIPFPDQDLCLICKFDNTLSNTLKPSENGEMMDVDEVEGQYDFMSDFLDIVARQYLLHQYTLNKQKRNPLLDPFGIKEQPLLVDELHQIVTFYHTRSKLNEIIWSLLQDINSAFPNTRLEIGELKKRSCSWTLYIPIHSNSKPPLVITISTSAKKPLVIRVKGSIDHPRPTTLFQSQLKETVYNAILLETWELLYFESCCLFGPLNVSFSRRSISQIYSNSKT